MKVLTLVEFGLGRSTLLRAIGVDEGVREDPIEPGPEIGPLLEPAEAAIGLQVGLLHEILGIGTDCDSCAAARAEYNAGMDSIAWSAKSADRPWRPRGDRTPDLLITSRAALPTELPGEVGADRSRSR